MQSAYTFSTESAVFDEQNLVSAAGLVPVLELAEQSGLSRLIGEHIDLPSTRVASGAVNAAGKLTTIIAGMMCGADSIDDVNVLRAGGTPRVFDEVYAPSTLGIFLREFSFGHSNQLAAVAREHLVALAAHTPLLPGIEQRAFLDIDSLLRPVYGHHKQGASSVDAKLASRALPRLGLSPQITTLSTAQAPPVIAEARLRSGRAGSGRAAARQVKQAITTARRCGAGTIMLRGDSAFGTKKVMATCVAEGIEFSVSVARNKRISTAIAGIGEHAYTPVHYPGAVADPDTGALISDAQVAETPYTLRLGGGRTLTVRLIVRRVKDARYPDALFAVWRYHPFVTNSDLPTAQADITHRRHAIIETTFADLIDGPLAHIPSGLFAANCAWLACTVIAHNLLRATGTLASGEHVVARGATLRRDLVNIPARFAAPARKPMLHLPAHWPWQIGWKTLWNNIIGHSPAIPRAG
ncbi:transposase [Mycobacterium heckeshornense]|uniref:IS1380 family transposase n=1 Tax=Mycobacterium heckeshornense TaxID=110505 RepID=UPI000C18EE6A|nr:IS1380 family transposase [Mycobacterium heckeshornense]PIJ34609.1 transposase [Mycobacterium heckeshornense]